MIIDVRRQLPWRRRLTSDLATASLWGLWLWLCRPIVSVFDGLSLLPQAKTVAHHAITHVAVGKFPLASVERGIAALVIVSVALWLWHKISERGGTVEAPATAPDYASHFQMSEALLKHCRAAQVCVVHHDAEGQIVAIRTVPTLPPTITAPGAPSGTSENEPATEFAEAA
ncbi:MAG TPA: poly-beta-1,6-N-acetyl-D-glucosamine biosynthesis protein PgaD [Hyphomonadaceae bacterium]|nr:poly-beta-1,6-N-acetyl-D-glucosamine biosynthesis protein PgaD [Hyphomonadaceae bacterium]